jgi:hypothetical protein
MASHQSWRHALALSWVAEALTWIHALEGSDDQGYKLIGLRVVIYPDILTKLGLGMDSHEELWPLYQIILDQCSTWAYSCQPVIIPESDPQWTNGMNRESGSNNVWRMPGWLQ